MYFGLKMVWLVFGLTAIVSICFGQETSTTAQGPTTSNLSDINRQVHSLPPAVVTHADPRIPAVNLPGSGAVVSEVIEKDSAKFPTIDITGFFHLDSAWFSQDALNRLTLGDIEDGLGFRRARLAAKGNVTDDMSFLFEFDIAQSQARFVDVWLQANNTPYGNIRIGRYRQPFGMSELTSVRELPFLERPVTFTQSPFRQTGIMFFDTTRHEMETWAVSGYRFSK